MGGRTEMVARNEKSTVKLVRLPIFRPSFLEREILWRGSLILKENMSRRLPFFSQFHVHRESSELWNSSECPRKFPEIFGNNQTIYRNSDTGQDKNLAPLAQKKLAGIPSQK